MNNQNLFNALQNVCGFTALESDMREIINAYEKDKVAQTNNAHPAPLSEQPLTPFGESIKLLRDLADLQNGAPLESYRKEWEKTMVHVYDFLNRWESQ